MYNYAVIQPLRRSAAVRFGFAGGVPRWRTWKVAGSTLALTNSSGPPEYACHFLAKLIAFARSTCDGLPITTLNFAGWRAILQPVIEARMDAPWPRSRETTRTRVTQTVELTRRRTYRSLLRAFPLEDSLA